MGDKDMEDPSDSEVREEDAAEEVFRNYLEDYIESHVYEHKDVSVEEIMEQIKDPDLIEDPKWVREIRRIHSTLNGFGEELLKDIVKEEIDEAGIMDSEDTKQVFA
jgi:hypothetical protein